MKKYGLFVLLLFVFGCQKTKKIGVDGGLQSDFSFKAGSYWIYEDSVSGAMDSVYVDDVNTQWHEKGCVKSAWATEYETITLSLKGAGSGTNAWGSWVIVMTENKLSARFDMSNDDVAIQMGYIPLLTYPIEPGSLSNTNGCTVTADSGTIQNIGAYATGTGGSYDKVAQSSHAGRTRASATYSYNDCFYTSPKVGFVRLVFNHPADSVYRVLNLVRYNVVR